MQRGDIRNASPPATVKRISPMRDFMRHTFARVFRPSGGAAGEFVFTTEALPQLDPFYGMGVRSGAPLGYGQRPLIALPTVTRVGMAFVPQEGGTLRTTPLSDNPNG